ncbi:GDSL-type esterase/lipase family protein [Microbacterium sp. A84]|uniref:GDSL-type esterase/lipase family protein n=1 Tax=Microbacterium sp. A84 TaxID=3450715 RepID=UPI003F43AA26
MNDDPAAEFEGPDIRACFFGDSFVAGVGDSSGLGWVGRVTAAARSAGRRLTSYNLGVRRETSVQVASRIRSEGPPRWADAEDTRLVVSFGVNDTSDVGGHPRVSVEDGLRSVRSAAQCISSERILLIGPPAVADDRQNALIEIRDGAFRVEAENLGIRFVSTFRMTMDDRMWRHQVAVGDGFHPDAGGYELLASVIEPVLLEWLAPLSIGPIAHE